MAEDGLPSPQRLARAASLMAVATVASRALGLLREVVAAWLFGATNAKAAYVIAYYLPFFVQRLLLGGTLSIVFIPTISRYLAHNDLAEARRLSGSLFTLVLLAGVAMVTLGFVVAPLLVPVAAPGFAASPELLELAVQLTRIIFPAMLFLALSVFVTGFLQAHHDFTASALAPLLFNITIITGTLLLGPRIGIRGLAFAWIAGTAAQFLVQLPAARRYGLRMGPIDLAHPAVRELARLAVPALALALREPLVRLIFQRGEFGPLATHAVAATLAGYAVGLPAIAAYYVVTRTYYALQDMATPVRIGVTMVIANAVLDYLLMQIWGVVGIALATSIVSAANVVLLLWHLRRRLGRVDGRRIASTSLRTGTAAVAAGLLMAAVAEVVRPVGLAGQSVQVGGAAVVGALAYVGICRLLSVEELRVALELLRRPVPTSHGET